MDDNDDSMKKELTTLLVQHFDEHQREYSSQDGIQDDVLQARARAKEIIQTVDEWATQKSLDNLSLDTDNNENESLEETLAAVLTHFMDCAVASTCTEEKADESTSSPVDAILSLAAAVAAHKAATGSTSSSVVAEIFLQRVVQYSTVLLERVRCAACRCIGWMVQSLLQRQQQAESSKKKGGVVVVDNETSNTTLADLLDTASQALVPRFIDKSQAVRQAAIGAAANFFTTDSEKMDDPDLRTSLQWALQHDPSVSNRIAALQALPVTVQTLPILLSRLRDTKRKVRVAAVQILQKKTDFLTSLDAGQCAGIVQAGLSDRDEEVQRETTKLLCLFWMKTAKFHPLTILKHVNVVEYEDACDKIVKALLDADDEMLAQELSDPEIRAYWQGIEDATVAVVQSKSDHDDDNNKLLDVEEVFFARARCQYVQDPSAKNTTTTRQKEALLTKVLPDIPVLCEIFELHSALLVKTVADQAGDDDDDDSDHEDERRSSAATMLQSEKDQDTLTCICLQLLQMASLSSNSSSADDLEEGARLHLQTTMTNMLGSILTPDNLVEPCVQTLQAVYLESSGFLQAVSDIVYQLQQDASSSSSSKDDGDNDNSDDDGLDDNRLLRILSILSILFERVSLQLMAQSSSTTILADFSSIIVPAVQHDSNELVREAAVACLGKLGLFSPADTVLRDWKPLLLKIVPNEEETLEIRAQAMLALSDWSILFGGNHASMVPPNLVAGDDTDDDNDAVELAAAFPDLVTEMMEHDELGMVCVAAEVACKLLSMGGSSSSSKICDDSSSAWLARLVVIFFDARLTGEDDEEIMEEEDSACEVGSPVRLQQLLSLFFPAYCHKSESNRHALVGAMSTILEALHAQRQVKNKRRRGASKAVSVAKVLDYVLDTVHSADQAAQENATVKNAGEDATTATNSEYSTPILMAAIQMASFIAKEHIDMKVMFLRTLCKHLGATNLDLEREKDGDLADLMESMEELGEEIEDATCLKSLAPLNDLLDDVELEDVDQGKEVHQNVEDEDGHEAAASEEEDIENEDEEEGDDDDDSLVHGMQDMAIATTPAPIDKENRSSTSSRRCQGLDSLASIGGTSSSTTGKRSESSPQRRRRLRNSNEFE